MAHKTEVVAMLLAGGQGSRLGVLTKNIAKPAVPYGGNYRIIDFPLSNCVNSGIYTVGVLTQYQPLELNDYLGNGQPWDLDRQDGGIHILSPYEAIGGAEWYKGTANAIYQNINFIEKYDPEYVVILSGDHIYKMNYAKMVDFHKKNNADCTIAVLEVPWEEASRFGILATDENKIEFTLDTDANGKTAKQIYDIVLKYMSELTQNEQNIASRVALVNDTEHVIANTMDEWLVFSQSFISLDRTEFKYQLIARISDNHLNLSLCRIIYNYEEGRSTGFKEPAEEVISDKIALNKKQNDLAKIFGKFRRCTIDRKDQIFAELTALVKQ